VKIVDSNDHIIDRPQYVVSYSKELNVANWVAYHLTTDDYGTTPRYSKNFITDTTLPDGYYRVKHSDYTNSGYDRGHLVKSEDRTRTIEDNISTFILTNIIPQTPDLNRLIWLQFENYLKDLVQKNNKNLYIVTGGVYYNLPKIKDRVSIPDSCWKVVLVLDSGQVLSDVNLQTQTIAVMMPNQNGLKGRSWTEFIRSVRQIEVATGYDFFGNLPTDIQGIIENRIYAPTESGKKK
jgi:endonuclease G